MNSNAAYRFHRLAEQVIRFGVILLLSATAYAQYGGGGMGGTTGTSGTAGTSSTPSYGHGKAIGIGVGAAAAGVVTVYLLTRSSKVTGCVQTADDGLRLTDDKTKKTLALVPGRADIKPGERVELKGKIKKNAAGDQSFLVKTVGKDFGECHTQAGASALSR
jgi:hypothetical protein